MKVLVVEDDDTKREQLVSFIESFYAVDVQSARSFQSGLRAILNDEPDLILLDMTMRNFDRSPTEDGGRPHPFAGREILRQMQRSKVQTPVVVVTAFDRFGEEADYMTLSELTTDLTKRFSNYIGTVQFKGNIDDWKPAMMNLIKDRLPKREPQT